MERFVIFHEVNGQHLGWYDSKVIKLPVDYDPDLDAEGEALLLDQAMEKADELMRQNFHRGFSHRRRGNEASIRDQDPHLIFYEGEVVHRLIPVRIKWPRQLH